MAEELSVTVRHEGRVWNAGIRADERTDQLLLKSLHHFGIDPREKTNYRLIEKAQGEERLVTLDHPVGRELGSGATVELRAESQDRQPSTGSY